MKIKIKEIRESKNISQSVVATDLFMSRSIYALYETNERIIPLKKLRDLCNYFGASIDYIFGLSKYNNYKYLNEVDKIAVGKKLKEFRDKEKLSQRDLAKILNTTHSTICAYELGKTLILTAFLYQICKKYNVSMDSFLDNQ